MTDPTREQLDAIERLAEQYDSVRVTPPAYSNATIDVLGLDGTPCKGHADVGLRVGCDRCEFVTLARYSIDMRGTVRGH